MNPLLTKTRNAEAAIEPHRFVKHGAADGGVLQAAASGDAICGASGNLGADAASDRIDIHTVGPVEIEFGATIVRGQPLTSDADGKAIPAVAPSLVQTVVAGGAAGDHAVADIAATDELVSVLQIDATDASEVVADLTAEFSVSAADTINNDGGTDTTGGFLVVTYRNPAVRIGGYAEVSGVAGDIADVMLSQGVLR